MLTVHMIGNAHIDPAWLWPWQAGVDEALATFRSAADRCDEYPEFIFTRGEAWLYQQVERIDPPLFDRVRKHVASGQWHVTGGQWVQPDVNLPTWAGLHRQFIHGRRYFQERFGVAPRVGYNVDSFGHPATLPDLLQAEGCIGYVFHRPSAAQCPVPASTFRWRGVNGGEVIGYRIPKPYVTRTHDLYGQIMLAVDGASPDFPHIMCFYGVGNHGGGPTKQNIEYILEHRNGFPGIELQFSTPERFFQAAQESLHALPVVEHELQHTFPGCYVVMHDIKQQQHRGEHLLEQARHAIDQWTATGVSKAQLHEQLDLAWLDLLFTQFHDVLAGTCIASAWPAVRGFQGRAVVTAEELLTFVTRTWARTRLPKVNQQQIAILNPNDAAWSGVIEHEPFLDFDAWGNRWLSDEHGRPITYQLVQPRSTIMLSPAVLFEANVAAHGSSLVLVRDGPPPPEVQTDLRIDAAHLANDSVHVEVSPRGIAQIRYNGRDLLGLDGITLQLRTDTADTWGFQIQAFTEEVASSIGGLAWQVQETGPLRARLCAQGSLGRSSVRWTLDLHRGEPALRMMLDVAFHERYRLLQMPIDLAAAPAGWTGGLAGGCVERAPASTEWPLHGWGCIDQPPCTMALVTPDAYSASLHESAWRWSLLRSPRMAWSGGDAAIYVGRDDHTDQGSHTFEFLLLLSPEEVRAPERLDAAAQRLTRRPIVFDRYEGMDRPPWGNSPSRRLWTGAEQRARADGRMAHLKDEGAKAVEEA